MNRQHYRLAYLILLLLLHSALYGELAVLEKSGAGLAEIPYHKPDVGSITHLTLNNNNITHIDAYTFALAIYSKLWYLSLTDNLISQIPDCAFYGTRLESVDLEHNRLKCIPNMGAIRTTLESLRLSYNDLGSCDDVIDYGAPYLSLRSLELAGNNLSSIPTFIHSLPNVALLDLSHNSITHLENLLELSPSLAFLKLSHNLLYCICENWWVKELVMYRGTCHQEGPLYGLQWRGAMEKLRHVCKPTTNQLGTCKLFIT